MSDTPRSPEARDRFARQLQDSLKQRRLRRLPWVLIGLPVLATALIGVWIGTRLPAEPPPLMLTCFDAVDAPGAWIEAQLVAPSEPELNLRGFDVEWKVKGDNNVEEQATTKTDRSGRTRYRLGSAPVAGVAPVGQRGREVQCSFVEPAGRYRRDDWALIVPPDLKRVAIAEVVRQPESLQWTASLAELPAPAFNGKERDVIYAVGPVDAATYRGMRAWLRHHQNGRVVPTGALLRESPAGIE